MPTLQRRSPPKCCPPRIFWTSICILFILHQHDALGQIGQILHFTLAGPPWCFPIRLYKFSFLFGFLRMLDLLKFAKRYPITDSLLVQTLMLAKTHTSPLPKPHVMFLLKAVTLRHRKLTDGITSSLLNQPIGLSFDTKRDLPRVCLVQPQQNWKQKGRVHTVTTHRLITFWKPKWSCRVFARFCYPKSKSWTEYYSVPWQLIGSISHSIHKWSKLIGSTACWNRKWSCCIFARLCYPQSKSWTEYAVTLQLIESINGRAACLPRSTSTDVKAERKHKHSRKSSVCLRFKNQNGPACTCLPGITSTKVTADDTASNPGRPSVVFDNNSILIFLGWPNIITHSNLSPQSSSPSHYKSFLIEEPAH